eukprot:Phypoly_transcript_08543.p1 GENE.Phypoly_transcript_08543~~Phypoly_transcript_08543.p1  ORF type:complete len:477 (+),score=59.90 Phypoly_transcript_08543:32-1462(+)
MKKTSKLHLEQELAPCYVSIEEPYPRLGRSYQAILPEITLETTISEDTLTVDTLTNSTNWTEAEKDLFDYGMTNFYKKFHQIQKLVKTKTFLQIIEYYYLWKYSHRYTKVQHDLCYGKSKSYYLNTQLYKNCLNPKYFNFFIDARLDWKKIIQLSHTVPNNKTLPQVQTQPLFSLQTQSPQIQSPQTQSPQPQSSQIQPQVQLPQIQSPQTQSPQPQSPQIQPQPQSPQIQPQPQSPQLQPQPQSPQIQPQPQLPQNQAPQIQPQTQVPQIQSPQIQSQTQSLQMQLPQTQLPQIQAPQMHLQFQLQTQIQSQQTQFPQIHSSQIQLPKIQPIQTQALPVQSLHQPPQTQFSKIPLLQTSPLQIRPVLTVTKSPLVPTFSNLQTRLSDSQCPIQPSYSQSSQPQCLPPEQPQNQIFVNFSPQAHLIQYQYSQIPQQHLPSQTLQNHNFTNLAIIDDSDFLDLFGTEDGGEDAKETN